jgi:hypothetical protein
MHVKTPNFLPSFHLLFFWHCLLLLVNQSSYLLALFVMQKYKLTLSRLNEESGQGSPEAVMENNRKAKSKFKPKSTKKPTHGT